MSPTRWRFGGHKTLHLSRRSARALVATAVLVPVVALPATAAAKTTLVGSGSSAAQPYMLALFKAYSKIHKNLQFVYNPDGGNAGVTDVQGGKSEFAIQTAAPVPADSGTIFEKLFLDALCIDVNSSNSLSNATTGTLKNIFTGIDTSWSQVSGSSLSSTIDPYGRNPTAGQYTFFKSAVLGSATQSSNVTQLSSDGLVAKSVEQNANGIGYIGLANSAQKGEKALEVNGVPCTRTYVKNKSYPLFRYDWAVLPKGHANVQVEQFFDWVRTSKAAGKVINSAGAVAAFNQ